MNDLLVSIGWAIVWGTGLCVCLWLGVWGIALILTAQDDAMTRRDDEARRGTTGTPIDSPTASTVVPFRHHGYSVHREH